MPVLLLAVVAAALGQSSWPTESPPPRWQGTDAWRESDFAVIQSELSPAVLVWSKAPVLRLFANLDQWELRGPSAVGARTRQGLRMLPAAPEARLAGSEMARPWLRVALDRSPGPRAWTAPWLVVLQHRPTSVVAGPKGLELQFPRQAGLVALMPGLPSAIDEAACEAWSRALRFLPVNCREEFRVLPGQDILRLRGRFEYVAIEDDWGTRGEKTAPLPPTLALALQTGFPAKLQPQPRPDFPISTAYGPYALVLGDGYTIDFPIGHLNQTETQQPPNLDDPVVAVAAEQVAQRMEQKFTDGSLDRIWDHGGGDNYCWQVMGDRWYAKALAYTPEPARTNAKASLAAYVREWVLNEARYKPFQGKLILEGPGIGNWGGYDDSGKFSSNILETLWCYAHYTGDWQAIRDRWPTLLRLFVTPRECRWRGFGRDAIAEMGDEAAPPLALARMAYQLGDLDTYGYASYLYARECVHLWVKTHPKAAEWFRTRQPWGSSEPMQGPVWLTNLWGDVAGWQIDGPGYPQQTGERQYRNRWVRFSNEDVGAFLRENLGEDILRTELDWWLTRADNPYKPGESTAHITPSMEQLRSLLLNESPAELAKLGPVQDAGIGRAADAISYYLSFVRTGRPIQYARLAPRDLPDSPWLLGLERESDGSDGALAVSVLAKDGHWPTLCDWGWKPPRVAGDLPGAERWPYGQIVAGDAPPALEFERLNWVTNVRYSP